MFKTSIIDYKPEIDCLRAVAVFLVILFHFDLFIFKGGFIGVDVFFVISGYLITNLVIKDIRNNRFSFIEFWTRRIRRIIPALYSTIFIVIILCYFVLSPDHFNRITKSGFSAATAYSNFFFWYESGYFDYNKYFKPLLHTWSLSVELQFYIIWPIITFTIFKLFKKKIIFFVSLIFLLSLFLSTIFSERTTGYFYFTLFRLFEFAIGSIIYLIKDQVKIKSNDSFFFIGMMIIISSSVGFSEKSIFPGINALVPCVGAALILITGGKLIIFKEIFINRFFIFFGKISYSLYLVHWPLITLYKYIKLEPLHDLEKILLIFVTIIISFFTYQFIELPFRKKVNNRFIVSTKKMIIIFILSLLSIILISNYFVSTDKFTKLSQNKQNTINKMKEEMKILENFERDALIRVTKKNYFNNNYKPIKVLIWGDSHAGDLYNSLNINNEFSKLDLEFLSYDYFYCFKDVAIYEKITQFIKNFFKFPHNCKEKVKLFPPGYDVLKNSDIIILSSRWPKKINFDEIEKFVKNYNTNKIIIVGRKPRFFHIPTLYIKSDKDLNHLAYINHNPVVRNINEEIKKKITNQNLIFFNIEDLICANKKCTVIDQNNLLVRDQDHWSYQGFIYYGKMLAKNKFLDIILDNSNLPR